MTQFHLNWCSVWRELRNIPLRKSQTKDVTLQLLNGNTATSVVPATKKHQSRSENQRLPIPRTLRKKLEKIVWQPIERKTAPGTTKRRDISGLRGPKPSPRQYSTAKMEIPSPTATKAKPTSKPASKDMDSKIRLNFLSEGRNPAVTANTLVKTAKMTP